LARVAGKTYNVSDKKKKLDKSMGGGYNLFTKTIHPGARKNIT